MSSHIHGAEPATVPEVGAASERKPLQRLAAAARRLSPGLVLGAAVILACLAIDAFASEEIRFTTIQMLINLVIVVGLYTFIGNSGVLSFGHTSFVAVGAYASALVTIPLATKSTLLPDLPGFIADASFALLPAALTAGLVAMVVGAVAGLAVVRLSGIQASIATFAVLVIVQTVLSNWSSLTRGEMTMTGVPLSTDMGGPLLAAIAAIAIAYAYTESRFGFRLRATREDGLGARALGISIGRERFIAFVISAFIVGIGGHLYAHLVGSFSPSTFYLDLTFLTLAMLIVGGRNSLAGAIVGTVVISVFLELVRRGEAGFVGITLPAESQGVAFALLTLAILIAKPNGIMGGRFS